MTPTSSHARHGCTNSAECAIAAANLYLDPRLKHLIYRSPQTLELAPIFLSTLSDFQPNRNDDDRLTFGDSIEFDVLDIDSNLTRLLLI